MTKRVPFGSHNPNLQADDADSVSVLSIPSLEEALQSRRHKKRKKNKATTIRSASKTPRISNRTRPPNHLKQLRRLEQSIANRKEKEQHQQQQSSPARTKVSFDSQHHRGNTTNQTDASDTNAGVKRKEFEAADILTKKRLKGAVASTSTDLLSTKMTGGSTASVADKHVKRAVDVSVDVKPSATMKEEAGWNKRPERHVTAKYLHNHRYSTNMSLRRAQETVQDPTVPTDDHSVMDCASDDESLQLSPDSNRTSPSRQPVELDSDWVLKGPTAVSHAHTSVVDQEAEELSHDQDLRLSTTIHYDELDLPRAPSTNNLQNPVGDQCGPLSMGTHYDHPDLPRSPNPPVHGESPIAVTLEKAREAKWDNEVVAEAMLRSGTPRTARKRSGSTSPDVSMRGIVIHTVDKADSLDDASEVTMLSFESFVANSPNADLEDSSVPPDFVARRSWTEQETALDYDATPSPPKKKHDRSSSQRSPRIRDSDPDREIQHIVGSCKINGVKASVMIPHPPLPSGWNIRVSESKRLLVYSHPDYGTSWHCPVVMSQLATEKVGRFLSKLFGKNGPESDDDNDESTGDETQSTYEETLSETESESSDVFLDPDRSSGSGQDELVPESGSRDSSTSNHRGQRFRDSATDEVVAVEVVEVKEAVDSGIVHRIVVEDCSSPKAEEHVSTDQLTQGESPAFSSSTSIATQPPVHHVAAPAASTDSINSLANSTDAKKRVSMEHDVPIATESRMVEETISTVHFSRRESGIVVAQDAGSEFVASADENEDEDKGKIHSRVLQSKTGVLQPDEESGFNADVDYSPLVELTEDKNAVAEAQNVVQQEGEDAKGVANNERFEADVDTAVFEFDHEGFELSPQRHRLIDAFVTGYPKKEDLMDAAAAVEDDGEVEDDLQQAPREGSTNEHTEGGLDDEGTVDYMAKQSKEAKQDEVSDLHKDADFPSYDDDGISLPTQEYHPSPSTDHDGVEDFSTSEDRNQQAALDHSTNPCQPKIFSSPVDSDFLHGDDQDCGPIGGEEHEQEDGLSAASSLTGTTALQYYRSSKWRGFSRRVIQPPCPLCSLTQIEELIKAYLERLNRRRKGKKARKSLRKHERDTATRLVFA